MKEMTAKWMATTLAVWALFLAGCDRMPPEVAADVAVLGAGPQVVHRGGGGTDAGQQPSTDQVGGLSAGLVKTFSLPGGADMEMVWCPPGSFWMGSPSGEEGRKDDETRRQVTLTEGFWMAKTEVTRTQWISVMGKAPGEEGVSGDTPATYLEWEDCQAFCRKTGLALPTEAQWEYACRAGSDTPYAGNGKLEDMGWYDNNTSDLPHPPGKRGLSPVGRKAPNAWGLYDMHGNVEEWCADWYAEYPRGDQTDPQGPANGEEKVLRGGNNCSDATKCRSASRTAFMPESDFGGLYGFGFRPVFPSEEFPEPGSTPAGVMNNATLDEASIRRLLDEADLSFGTDGDGNFTIPLEWLTGRTQNVTIRRKRGGSPFEPVWEVSSIGQGSFFGGSLIVPGGLRQFVEEDTQIRETGEWSLTENRDMAMWLCEFSVPLTTGIDGSSLRDLIAYVGETADELEQKWRSHLGDVF
jgi:formylglycine-generating enzyme required for sulfatase activity